MFGLRLSALFHGMADEQAHILLDGGEVVHNWWLSSLFPSTFLKMGEI